jgi:hypothetical protein
VAVAAVALGLSSEAVRLFAFAGWSYGNGRAREKEILQGDFGMRFPEDASNIIPQSRCDDD